MKTVFEKENKKLSESCPFQEMGRTNQVKSISMEPESYGPCIIKCLSAERPIFRPSLQTKAWSSHSSSQNILRIFQNPFMFAPTLTAKMTPLYTSL